MTKNFNSNNMKKSGKTYIWPDKQDISWETVDKLVATVAEPTINDLILFSILRN
jgi:hypothetical protein